MSAPLRPYRPQDFDQLLKIDQQCFVQGIAYTPDELRYFVSRPSATTLVAEAGGHIQGFVIADRFRSRSSGKWMGHLITIDVDDQARRTGLGTTLLAAAEHELKNSGCSSMVLEVAVNNSAALAFYKKHGFTVLKALPRYYLDSLDGLLMGKPL